jgi:DNA-binding MarR family transcriptional regulator
MNCVGYRVRMLSRVITGIYDDALAPLKLKGSQFNLLDVVSRRGSCAPSAIHRLTRMDKSTASRTLERMRRRGWLSIETGSAGRGQTVSITGKGTRTLRAAYPLWKKAQTEAMRRLGPDGFRALQIVMRSVKGE